MGNCSGLFANCTGQDSETQNAVRKIDKNDMAAALEANEKERLQG